MIHTAASHIQRTLPAFLLGLALLFFHATSHAQVLKYRTPTGKLLFTDQEIYEDGYTLIGKQYFGSQSASNNTGESNHPGKFQRYIVQAAKRHGVDETLIKAIIKAESDFDPDALSRAGAQGLMQLMPKTARTYNVHNSYNSEQNIDAGTRHIKYLLGKYQNNLSLALAAYNAGETAVNKHGGIPPYPETQRYVQKVFQFKNEFESASH